MRMEHVTVDCENAVELAQFWSAAMGWGIGEGANEDFAFVGEGRPSGVPALMLLKVPEAKATKNRVHLDFHVADLTAEIDRLVGLGATVVHEKNEFETHWFTLTDPEGNEFCVAAD